MIELIIYNYLSKNMPVPVFLEEPEDRPSKYILFEKTSGGKENHTNSATFAFQSYAPSLYEASQLNEELKNTIENIIELNEIAFAKLNSDYNFTDTQTKRYRYQAVYDFKY